MAGTHTVHLFAAGRRLATSRRQGLGDDAAAPLPAVDGVHFYHPDPVGSNTVVTEPDGSVERIFQEHDAPTGLPLRDGLPATPRSRRPGV